jgi:hypothetical protein
MDDLSRGQTIRYRPPRRRTFCRTGTVQAIHLDRPVPYIGIVDERTQKCVSVAPGDVRGRRS